jgi:hypothetical protein
MAQLTELAIKYGTDKWGKHNYTPYYHELFKDRRETVKKVLEIGAAEGAGLRMFRDYFPNAMVYGAEIDKKRIFKEDRIEVIECDQSKVEDLAKLLEKTGFDIDIMIDDGSHKPKDQVLTALTVLPLIKKEAIYVIEDVADPSIIEYFEDYACEIVKLSKRYDDRLLIIRQK